MKKSFQKIEILFLIVITFFMEFFMQMSHIDIGFNLIQFSFILVHFTLVVGITVFLLDRADTTLKKEIAWITFAVLFAITFFIQFILQSGVSIPSPVYLFQDLLLSSMYILFQPLVLIFAVASVFIIRYSDKLNKRFLKSYLVYTLLIIFIILMLGFLFLPFMNKFASVSGGYYENINKSNIVYGGTPENKWFTPIIPIYEKNIYNPSPFNIYVPVDSGANVCFLSKQGLLMEPGLVYGNGLNYFIETNIKTWTNENDWYEPGFPKDVINDPSYGYYKTKYPATTANKLILRIPAFSKVDLKIGSIFGGFSNSNDLDQQINKIGSIKLFLTKENDSKSKCTDTDYYKEIKFE